MNRTAQSLLASAGLLLVLCAAGIVLAQTAQPWDTNIISFTPPTTCSTGEQISQCPITGYRLERAPSSSGTFASLTTLAAAATGYTHTGAAAGVNCYRVVVLSAQGDSAPSNVSCKTNVKPAGPPNPAVLKSIDTVAYSVRPNYQRFVFERGPRIGTVQLGAACDEARSVGGGLYALERPRAVVTPRPQEGIVVLARCG